MAALSLDACTEVASGMCVLSSFGARPGMEPDRYALRSSVCCATALSLNGCALCIVLGLALLALWLCGGLG